MAEDKDIIRKLNDAGLKNYPIHRGEVQDGVLVKVTLVIEDKEVIITR